MRTLYFDCFSGVSGDMILGALVDLGVEPNFLIDQLSLLGVEGFQLEFEKVDRSGISASRVLVKTEEHHHHRHLSNILNIIDKSRLGEGVKERAGKIFTRLAEAEAKVHRVPVERIHFHEVGALDAIVDVVGACIGFDRLGVERFFCSPLNVGSGMVEMAHGRFPIPPPAVAELLRGAPIYSNEVTGELVTPTGAAVVSTLAQEFGTVPAIRVEATGYGAGSRDYPRFPNVLRLMLGKTDEDRPDTAEKVVLLETNVDDMSPQIAGFIMDQALQLGALDCYFTPVQMKKNRPGLLISVICRPADSKSLTEMLISESTTLGVRFQELSRSAMQREVVRVETVYGEIDVKVSSYGDSIVKVMPEFDHCREAAVRHNVALREVTRVATAAAEELIHKD
jgi:pyridinium-3,5-bisthiocarboxylic acid mononucleotide nickel chelatase